MKFDEALKLQNFKEHYSIILGNVTAANDELGRILIARGDQERHITTLEGKISDLSDGIVRLETIRAQVVSETDSRINEANERELFVQKEEARVKAETESRMEALELEVGESRNAILEMEKTLASLREKEPALTKSVSSLFSQAESLSTQVSVLGSEASALRAEKDRLNQEIDASLTSHRVETSKRNVELAEIGKLIIESEKKVLDADAHMDKKTKDIARRENDVLIITKRLRTLFQEVRPGVALKI